jgi:hypothetical protein
LAGVAKSKLAAPTATVAYSGRRDLVRILAPYFADSPSGHAPRHLSVVRQKDRFAAF